MNALLRRGGFILQTWNINREEIIREIENESQMKVKERKENLDSKIDSAIKILGLTWNRSTDEFQYTVKLTFNRRPITKRQIISDIARLYDPLGRIVITAKMFIQKLWLTGLEWDEEVPNNLMNELLIYLTGLFHLVDSRIPR